MPTLSQFYYVSFQVVQTIKNFPNCTSANVTLIESIFIRALGLVLPSVGVNVSQFACLPSDKSSKTFPYSVSSLSSASLTFNIVFISGSVNDGILLAKGYQNQLNQSLISGNLTKYVLMISHRYGYKGLDNVTYAPIYYLPIQVVTGHIPPQQAAASEALTSSSYVGIAFASLFVCLLCCGLAYYVYASRYSEKEPVEAPPMLDSNGEVLIDFARAYPGTEGEIHSYDEIDDTMRTSLEGVSPDDIRQSIQVIPISRGSLFGDSGRGSIVGNLMSRMSSLSRITSSNTSIPITTNSTIPTGGKTVTQQVPRPRPISSSRSKSVDLNEPPKALLRKKSVNKQLSECTVDDVSSILRYLNMGKYIPMFVDNGISGGVLQEAETSNDLKECGITMPGPILRAFFSQIEEYKRSGVPSSVIGSPISM